MQVKSFRDTLKQILDLAQDLLKSEAGTIFLLDNERDELVFEIVNGPKADELKGKRLKIGEGIAGKTAQTGEGQIVTKVKERKDFQSKFDRATGFKTESLLTAPLRIKDRIIGVIELVNKKDGVYTEDDLQILEGFAKSASSILEMALLYERIEQSRKFLYGIIDSIPHPILLLDKEGNIVYQNRALNQLPFKEELIKKTMNKKNGDTIECNGKTFTLTKSSFNMRDEVGRMVEYTTLIFVEITDKIMLAELMAQKEVKERFFAGVSHNLKNPLTPIIGLSQILMSPENLSDDVVKEYAKRINQEGQRLGKLVQMFISLSREDLGNRSWVNIGDMLKRLENGAFSVYVLDERVGIYANGEDLELALGVLFETLKEKASDFNVRCSSVDSEIQIIIDGLDSNTVQELKRGMEQEFLIDDPFDRSNINSANLVFFREIIERNGGNIEYNNDGIKIKFFSEMKNCTGKLLEKYV
ncbi:hypothetical protein DRQ23_00625 [bacterium]|nr:MAG: hypothetical protein DRQ23_00625 [bacterium]